MRGEFNILCTESTDQPIAVEAAAFARETASELLVKDLLNGVSHHRRLIEELQEQMAAQAARWQSDLSEVVAKLEAKIDGQSTHAAQDADDVAAQEIAYNKATITCRELQRMETEATLNFHQATSYYCMQPTYPLWRKFVWFFMSLGMVFIQVFCTLNVAHVAHPICVRNADCLDGMYCEPEAGHCQWCGADAGGSGPYDAEVVANTSNSTTFCYVNPAHYLCEACIELREQVWLGGANDHGWSSANDVSFAFESVGAMAFSDWASFSLACFVVAMELSAEHRDIALRVIASRQFPPSRGWNFALLALDATRRYTLSASLLLAIINLVFYLGSSTIDIFFNTLALLFILGLDNSVYAEVLSDVTRSEVEALGRARMDTETHRLLSGVRVACVLGFTLASLVSTLGRFLIDGIHFFHVDFLLVVFVGVRASWLEGATCGQIAAGIVFFAISMVLMLSLSRGELWAPRE